jgi:hypothetical protein
VFTSKLTNPGIVATELMEQIFTVHGVPQVVHADRRRSMLSKTVAALLVDLDVTRPLFSTLEYRPELPESFGSLAEARQFTDTLTKWYHHDLPDTAWINRPAENTTQQTDRAAA